MTRSERRLAAGGIFSLVFFGLVGACSSPSEHPPPAGGGTSNQTSSSSGGSGTSGTTADSGAGDGAVKDAAAADSGTGCVVGTQLGLPVAQNIVAGSAPAPAGGTVVAGTYILTAMNYYGGTPGPSGVQGQYTFIVSASQFVIVGTRVAGTIPPAAAIQSTTQTFAQSGTQLLFGLVCPLTGSYPTQVDYTATPTQLIINRNAFDAEIYTKQ